MDKRLGQHNEGRSKSTRHGVPWRLMYNESFAARGEAMQRKRYFKTGVGRRELDERIG